MSDIPQSSDQFTKPIALVLCYAVATMVVAQTCLFTILPPIGRQIGLNEFEIGAVMSIHGVFMLVAGPWWGAISETTGRRRVILIGAVVYTASVLLFGVVIDAALSGAITSTVALWLLIGTRSIFAVGAGAVTPASTAMAADLSSRENRLKAMSMLAAAVGTGAVLGPGAPALFAGLGLAAPFYFIGGLGLIAIIAARLVLPATHAKSHITPPSFRNLLRGRVLAIALSSWCFMCGNYGAYAVYGFYIQDKFQFGAVDAAQWTGIGLMCASGLSVLCQSFIISRIKLRVLPMVLLGGLTCIVSIYWTWTTTEPWFFVASLMLNGFGQSFVNPAIATSLSLSVGASGQGRLAGLSTSTQAMAFLVGPVTSAVLYGMTPVAPFVLGPIFITVAIVLTLGVARKLPNTVQE